MQAASREALHVTEDTFRELALGSDVAGLSAYADQLGALARLLVREIVLRKHLTDAVVDGATKRNIAGAVFAGKLDETTLGLLKLAVEQRWSSSRDLATAFHRFAQIAMLIEAERSQQLEDVEDELFRFGRVIEANPELATLLGDASTDPGARVGLLRSVLAGKANTYTFRLLEDAVRWPYSSHFAATVDALAELAAARRGESVAHVVAAAPLTDEQTARLAAVLGRIYGRTISVQTDIDPEVLGGVRITVSDEVIDGTIASRLADAASQLPGGSGAIR